MNIHPGFQATAAMLSLTTAAVLWFIGRQRWPRLILFFVVAGVGGLVDLGFGFAAGIRHAISNLAGYIDAHSHSFVGSAISWIIVLVLVAVVVFHVIHQTIDEKTLAAGAGVALTATLVPALPGQILVGILGACVNLSGMLFSVFFTGFH